MSLVLQVLIPLLAGAVAIALAPRWPRPALAIAIVAAAATVAVALTGRTDDALLIGQTGLEASPTTRALAVVWASGLVLLALLASMDGRLGPAAILGGSGLLGLGASMVALAVDDATLAFAALAGGGIAAAAAAILGGWLLGTDDAPGTELGARALGAIGAAGLAGLAIAAWSRSPAGPLGSAATGGIVDAEAGAAIGVAVVAIAAATILRSGAIPAHLWAARLAGVMSPLAVPGILAWGGAAFTIVAVGWAGAAVTTTLDGLDRAVIVIAALASIVFGGLAAILHDDLEHVLGYLVVQDAGVALLAFAAPRPEVVDSVATWVIAVAALRAGFAGWIAAARWTFGTHRVSDLRGWARRSPLLGLALLLVVVGSVGLPGMALFDARADLATAAVGSPFAALIVVLSLSPVLSLGRLLAAGVGQASPAVASARDERVGRSLGTVAAWSRGGAVGSARAAAAIVRANEGLGVGLAALLLAVLGIALATVGVAAFAGPPGG